MTREQAFEFLRQNQPLPSDENLTRDAIDMFDEVRKYFLAHPDPAAVPLLLNSFGQGSGFGVYQLVEDAVAKVPKGVVVPHLIDALGSQHPGVKYWSAQIAARFPDPRLVPPLARAVRDPDQDLRYAAITALEQVGDDAAVDVLRKALEAEPAEEIRALLADALGEKRSE